MCSRRFAEDERHTVRVGGDPGNSSPNGRGGLPASRLGMDRAETTSRVRSKSLRVRMVGLRQEFTNAACVTAHTTIQMPGNTRQPRQRLSQSERRVQLLGGALAEAANVGLGRLTHAGVARECGVAVPTVFSYFENRTALVIATVNEVKRFYLELAGYWHHPRIPALAAINGHLNAYADSIVTEPDYARVWLEWCTAVRNEDGIWDSFLDYHDQLIKLLSRSIRRGQKDGEIHRSINATDAARLVVASAITVTQLHFMCRNKREINRFIDQSLRLSLQHEFPDERGRGD